MSGRLYTASHFPYVRLGPSIFDTPQYRWREMGDAEKVADGFRKMGYATMRLYERTCRKFGYNLDLELWHSNNLGPFSWGSNLGGRPHRLIPRRKRDRRFAEIWDVLSGGYCPYDKIPSRIEDWESEILWSTLTDLSAIYAAAARACKKDEVPKPPRRKTHRAMNKWLTRCRKESGADIMLQAYFDGVPLEDILA